MTVLLLGRLRMYNKIYAITPRQHATPRNKQIHERLCTAWRIHALDACRINIQEARMHTYMHTEIYSRQIIAQYTNIIQFCTKHISIRINVITSHSLSSLCLITSISCRGVDTGTITQRISMVRNRLVFGVGSNFSFHIFHIFRIW